MPGTNSRPELGWLFLDLNSYFATVEQEAQPRLRGLPIAIIPVEAETTCCIAVSYQAKVYGVSTGMSVAMAKQCCPHLVLVNARPRVYVDYHHRILSAIERHAPVQQVLSCDEFSVQLAGTQRHPDNASALAYAIKQEIRGVGTALRCSIGLGPNRLMAKIAGEMQKPDGLMQLRRSHLPHALFPLALRDIPGVGRRMERRLVAQGIDTARKLCELSRHRMNALWGGVQGDRLWLALQGEDLPKQPAGPAQTMSRQHILPPDCRTMDRARGIALKLLHSTARRMRSKERWAGGVFLQLGMQSGRALQGGALLPPTQDTMELQACFTALWSELLGRIHVSSQIPTDLTIVLTDLQGQPQPQLFAASSEERSPVMQVLDGLNTRFGGNTVYFGSIHHDRQQAPTRISFGPPPPLAEFSDTADRYR